MWLYMGIMNCKKYLQNSTTSYKTWKTYLAYSMPFLLSLLSKQFANQWETDKIVFYSNIYII